MKKVEKMWEEFCDDVKYYNRYNPKHYEKIENIIKGSKNNWGIANGCSGTNDKGMTFGGLYRARIDNKNEVRERNDIGKVPIGKASEGRFNPKGVSYFYVASNKFTALHEVRPKLSDTVAIGMFDKKNSEKLKICDFFDSSGEIESYHTQFLNPEEKYFRKFIVQEFKKEVFYEDPIDYVPMQYIISLVKSSEVNYDGIVYGSVAVKGEVNFLFFDDSKFELIGEIERYKITRYGCDPALELISK